MNYYSEKEIAEIVSKVIAASSLENTKALPKNTVLGKIPVEVSARHVHLSASDAEILFGPGVHLTPKRDLSQPGQFLCEERVKLVTPKGEFNNVAVLGPLREKTQVELSASDARNLGISAPVRLSGDLKDAGDIFILGPCGMLYAKESTIIAKAHIHLAKKDATDLGVIDGQRVKVRLETSRPLCLEDVIIRVSDKFKAFMHIDFDEANAALVEKNATGLILSDEDCYKEAPKPSDFSQKPSCPEKEQPSFSEKLITEEIARKLLLNCKKQFVVPKGVLITPAAKDVFTYAHITLVQ